MDWLSMLGATLDCPRKEVRLHTLDDREVCFIDERKLIPSCMISALTATKLLRKGCEAYLACVVTTESKGAEFTNILIVRRFFDVFSEELPRLPPDRDLEFSIDLIPGTRPIAMAPYRMAPAELRELQTQLQELLDKGFIRPSVSPWGADMHKICIYFIIKNQDFGLNLLSIC